MIIRLRFADFNSVLETSASKSLENKWIPSWVWQSTRGIMAENSSRKSLHRKLAFPYWKSNSISSYVSKMYRGPLEFCNCYHASCWNGSPQPNLTWWRESVLLDNSVEVKTTSYVKNILKIPSLQRHDLMAAFICEASNSEFTPPFSTSVTVDMNFRPLEVHLKNGRHFSAGKPAEIECITAGSRPPAKISWWKGNVRQMTAKSVVSVNGNSTTSILTFTPNMEDDGVYLSCAAENRLVPGSDMEDGIKLEIHYVPQVFLRLGSKLRHSHIQECNDVYLECNIRANPVATYIGWTFDGQEIYTNTTLGIIVSNQTLVLQKVKKSSRGHYTCTATNTEGQGESNNVFLRVQYTPICDSQQRSVYRTGINEPVQVTCKLKSDPTNVTFSWTFNNSYDNFELFSFTTQGTTSTATYTPKSKYEFGTLICFGTNNVGTQKTPCRFAVIPAGIPEPVRNCSLFNQTDHGIGVECVKGDHGGFTQLFYVEIEELSEQRKIFNMSSSSPAFYIKNLPPGTTFIFKVYSYNMEGRSEPVLFRGNTLDVRPSSSTGGANWVFSVNVILIPIVSVCTVLIIIVGCAMLILKMKLVRTRDETGTVDNKINCTQKNHTPREGNSKDLVQGKSPDVIPDVKYFKVPFRGIDQRRNSSKTSRQETSKDKNVVSPLKEKYHYKLRNELSVLFPELRNELIVFIPELRNELSVLIPKLRNELNVFFPKLRNELSVFFPELRNELSVFFPELRNELSVLFPKLRNELGVLFPELRNELSEIFPELRNELSVLSQSYAMS
ncbi:neural cell adhesion molecule 1-like [Tachypleus tridentatus]|uniref:neural cell adhesion molecule 1-like n=1 Tax=Tachypleus tridentatus TaxID=6853 RepID=UPI003FD4930A